MNAGDLVTSTPKLHDLCVVCHRHKGACVCTSHAPVPVEQLAEIADQPTEFRGARWSKADIEHLVREAHQHYYNRDPAALERLIRGMFR